MLALPSRGVLATWPPECTVYTMSSPQAHEFHLKDVSTHLLVVKHQKVKGKICTTSSTEWNRIKTHYTILRLPTSLDQMVSASLELSDIFMCTVYPAFVLSISVPFWNIACCPEALVFLHYVLLNLFLFVRLSRQHILQFVHSSFSFSWGRDYVVNSVALIPSVFQRHHWSSTENNTEMLLSSSSSIRPVIVLCLNKRPRAFHDILSLWSSETIYFWIYVTEQCVLCVAMCTCKEIAKCERG